MKQPKKQRFLLPLNIQYFADIDPQGDDPIIEPTGGVSGEGVKPTDGEPDKIIEPKTFTQDQLDAIIADRLTRERKKQDEAAQKLRDEAEQTRLKENGEYKELADKRQEQVDLLQAQLDAQAADVLKAKKEALLVKAGYADEQVEKLSKYVEGATDEELAASIDALKADVPPKQKFADPSAGNGTKVEPKKTDLRDKGISAYQRLKEKGKIRR